MACSTFALVAPTQPQAACTCPDELRIEILSNIGEGSGHVKEHAASLWCDPRLVQIQIGALDRYRMPLAGRAVYIGDRGCVPLELAAARPYALYMNSQGVPSS
jgi:hypothetical protein